MGAVATGTVITIAVPVAKMALQAKYNQCKISGSRFPILCTVATPAGFPPPKAIVDIVSGKKTFTQVKDEQTQAIMDGLAGSGIDPDKALTTAIGGIVKDKKPEKILADIFGKK